MAGVQDMIFRVRAGRIVKISRADNIRPYKIMLAWNIAIAVCRQYLHLQNPVISTTIITTSKLVVCTAPIRGAYWLSP